MNVLHTAACTTRRAFFLATALLVTVSVAAVDAAERPNVVLVMADDMGWGQTGYYGHPILKTPNLDAMAKAGLRFDRFYAAGPVCSPTRASVLTGRTHNRTGVPTHGHALHRQEKSLATALKKAGYATGHFGKWHLNGVRGPGVPVLASDPHHPGHFGFDEWLTVTNYFDLNPLMSHMGEFEAFEGDSSEIVVDEALKFAGRQKDRPFLAVIWYGSPHSPWRASETDQVEGEEDRSANHHGELVAMDRSIGTLRAGLRKLGVADDTIVWFCSDNGGLAGVGHDSVGGLRGHKGTVWEGGIRVPGIVEWPAGIEPRVTEYPASTMDVFPTLVDLLDLPADSMLDVVDGTSLVPLWKGEIGPRKKPIPFRFQTKAALVDDQLKLVTENVRRGPFLLFDLEKDKAETRDLSAERPEEARRLRALMEAMVESVERSRGGADYPEGRVTREGPHGRFWYTIPEYQPHLAKWAERPEFVNWAKRGAKKKRRK